MTREIRKGARSQLIGLNLWTLCGFLGFVLFSFFLSSFMGFLFALGILILFLAGGFKMFRGLYHLTRGSSSGRGRSVTILSIFFLLFSPFVFGVGFVSPPPMNYILIQLGLLLFLSSLVMPYLGQGGLLTGIPAILSAMALSIVVLGYVMYASKTLPWTLPFGLGSSYFILLELTVFMVYLKAPTDSGSIPGVGEAIQEIGSPTLDLSPVRPIGKGPEPVRRVDPPRNPITDIPSSPDRSRENGRTATSFEEFVREMGPPRSESPHRTVEPLIFREAPRRKKDPSRERVEAEVEAEIDLDMDDVLMDGKDLYSILKVERSATITDLRRAYRKRAMLYHPDLNRDAGEFYRETINEEMRKLNKAKEVLFDPLKRAEYDRQLEMI